jgi:hypothetical protein
LAEFFDEHWLCFAFPPGSLYVLTQTGVTMLAFAADPLSIGEVQASGNQLTILGSGFSAQMSITVDGAPATMTYQNSQQIVASVSSLSSGPHQIVVTLPSGASYTLDNALDISAAAAPSASATRSLRAPTNMPAPSVVGPAPREPLWQRLHRHSPDQWSLH